MKVDITYETFDDYRESLEINIGKVHFRVCDGEPEDSNLMRDFNDCYKIVEMLQIAWDAGQRNDPLEFEYSGEEL